MRNNYYFNYFKGRIVAIIEKAHKIQNIKNKRMGK